MRHNNIDTLDSHFLWVQNVGAKTVVGDDRVRVFLRRLNELLKRWLCLFFVSLEKLNERNVPEFALLACILKNSAAQSHIIIGVDINAEIKQITQLFVAEDQSSLHDDQRARVHLLSVLEPDLEVLIVDRLVEGDALLLQVGQTFDQEVVVNLPGVVEVYCLVDRLNFLLYHYLVLFEVDRPCSTAAQVTSDWQVKIDLAQDD